MALTLGNVRWRRLGAAYVLAAAAVGSTLIAAPALAQSPDEQARASAREIGKQAVDDYNAGNYAAALDGFSRAHALVNLSTTGLWRARSLAKLGRLVEASEQYLQVRRMDLSGSTSDTHREAQRDAGTERDALLERIPRLTIDVGGALPKDTLVLLDGAEVATALVGAPQLVDPGKHVIVIKRGNAEKRHEVVLAEKQNERLTVELPPAPELLPPTPKPTPTPTPIPAKPAPAPEPGSDTASGGVLAPVGWTLVALGGAGLIAGGVTGGLALDRNSTLEAGCLDGNCPPPFHDDVDAFNLLRTTSTITFIAGGVLAATGLTLVIVDATSDSEPADSRGRETVRTTRLDLRVHPSGLTLLGSF